MTTITIRKKSYPALVSAALVTRYIEHLQGMENATNQEMIAMYAVLNRDMIKAGRKALPWYQRTYITPSTKTILTNLTMQELIENGNLAINAFSHFNPASEPQESQTQPTKKKQPLKKLKDGGDISSPSPTATSAGAKKIGKKETLKS